MEEARKPSVQSWLVGLREWSLKWLERWLAKRGITVCRSWIWWAAFGLSKRWALHNPIFLPKHWDTLSLERQRWKHRVCACLCVCFLFTDVAAWPWHGPWGSSERTVGGQYKVACARDKKTKWQRDNVHKSWSALSRRRQSPNCNSPEIDSQPCAHFCISLPLCKRIKGTFKERQRDWPGACRVPFLTTGGPGQIKSARAAQPALLPAFASCAVY